MILEILIVCLSCTPDVVRKWVAVWRTSAQGTQSNEALEVMVRR